MIVCWVILRGQQIYTVIQAVHSLLYVVVKCHFFSVVTWKDIISQIGQKIEILISAYIAQHLCACACACVKDYLFLWWWTLLFYAMWKCCIALGLYQVLRENQSLLVELDALFWSSLQWYSSMSRTGSGALGCFGYRRITELLRFIEYQYNHTFGCSFSQMMRNQMY